MTPDKKSMPPKHVHEWEPLDLKFNDDGSWTWTKQRCRDCGELLHKNRLGPGESISFAVAEEPLVD